MLLAYSLDVTDSIRVIALEIERIFLGWRRHFRFPFSEKNLVFAI